MRKRLIPKGQNHLKMFAPDMSDEQKTSTTYVTRDSQPLVVYERYHEPEVAVEDDKLKIGKPSAATVSYRKLVANRGKTDELRLQEYTNNAIAQAQSQLDNDPVSKFAKTAGDIINETRHMVPAMLMATKIPLFFGAGAAWEGANLAYDAYHNDRPGMYRSVFEPAGFALLDAAVNPATWQFLGNTAKRAGSYIYNRAVNPVALYVNNRVVKPTTLWVSSIPSKVNSLAARITYPTEALLENLNETTARLIPINTRLSTETPSVMAPVQLRPIEVLPLPATRVITGEVPTASIEKPTPEEMRLYVEGELSRERIGLDPLVDNAATIEDLYNTMKEFNKSYSLESAAKIDRLLRDDLYTIKLMAKLREAVLAGDLNAIDLYRNSTYYEDLGGITGNELKSELLRKLHGRWTPADELNLKRRLVQGLGHFSEFNNPNMTREAFQIAQILKETPGSLVYESSLSSNSAPLFYSYLIKNLRNGSVKGLDLVENKPLNIFGKPYYLYRRPNGKIAIRKLPGGTMASDLDVVDYLLNPQISEINKLWPGNNFPYATLDNNGNTIIPYLRAHFKRGGKLIKRKKKNLT